MDSKFKGALLQKCPKCLQGDVFVNPLFSIDFSKTHINCPNCNLRFENEPGFFYGAMYFSYALNVAIIITTGLSVYFIFKPTTLVHISVTVMAALFLVPLTFRYSRILMLYLFRGV